MLLTLPQRTLETFKIPQIEDIIKTFPTNRNKPPWSKRPTTDIKYLVIHHSASTGTLEAENRYHINNNNWYKLSYHFSIDRGHIYQINDILDVTPHALGANQNGIGVCVNWDLRIRPLSDFEKNALYGLIIAIKELFPNIEVVGHNEISMRLANHSTSCPVISMKQFRSDLMTAELNQHLNDTPNDVMAKIFAAQGRINDLYATASKKGPYQLEAQRKYAIIIEAMVKAEILKTG